MMNTKKRGSGASPEGAEAYEPPVCRVLADSEGDGACLPVCMTEDATRGGDASEVDINIGICPYFKRDRGNGRVSCEGASFRFPDRLARREYLYRFCAHPEGYKLCPLKVALDHYYERKYDYHA
jgi:hypothetical protein